MTLAIAWTADRVAVVIAGAAACVVIYRFFFGKRSLAPAAGPPQEATVVVSGGYDPPVVTAKKGVPLRLLFDRREDNPCSDEIVLPEFGVRQTLPPFAKTSIEILPRRSGEFPFSCGMNRLHGTIRVIE